MYGKLNRRERGRRGGGGGENVTPHRGRGSRSKAPAGTCQTTEGERRWLEGYLEDHVIEQLKTRWITKGKEKSDDIFKFGH